MRFEKVSRPEAPCHRQTKHTHRPRRKAGLGTALTVNPARFKLNVYDDDESGSAAGEEEVYPAICDFDASAQEARQGKFGDHDNRAIACLQLRPHGHEFGDRS